MCLRALRLALWMWRSAPTSTRWAGPSLARAGRIWPRPVFAATTVLASADVPAVLLAWPALASAGVAGTTQIASAVAMERAFRGDMRDSFEFLLEEESAAEPSLPGPVTETSGFASPPRGGFALSLPMGGCEDDYPGERNGLERRLVGAAY